MAVMDIKCPGSGEAAAMDLENIDRLRPYDEVKFVISDRHDFEWAERLVRKQKLCGRCHAVLFSPVDGKLAPAKLASWVMDSGLPVRMQIQLHKVLGVL